MRLRSVLSIAAVTGMLVTTAACGSGDSGSGSKDRPDIAILNLANVPSLNDIVDGVIAGLAEQGYGKDKIKLDSQNANGDIGVAQSIAAKFAQAEPDVIVTVTTPALQAAINATRPARSIPIVFGGVSDPVAAGAVKSLEGATGTNVTGVYNVNPIPGILDVGRQMLPNLKKVGIIYNPGEDNSVADVKVMKKEAATRGIEVVEATADNSNNVQAAAQSIVGKVDTIILIQDTTVATAQAVVNKVARAGKVPVLAIDAQLVEEGAVAGLGRDNRDTGRQLAKKVVEILKGAKPGDVPLEPVQPAKLVVNEEAARLTGFTVPAEVLAKAKVV
ncbi:ABC transporter substrate-binding protein [Dactylosporangium sp. CA-233914]|uniref:ABC transporter substrate-binding protein n=1 Tax=Dactylosporangium sp. CA-233914 TaxID=3239934 RepID=UPI003D8AC368